MRNPQKTWITLLAGVGLAAAATQGMGWLAAIALPPVFFEQLGRGALAFLVHTTLLVQLPGLLLAFALGWLLFRKLGDASLRLVLVGAAPWLVWMVYGAQRYYLIAELPALERLGYLLDWRALPGLLSVPLGLWLAARAVSGGATPAQRAPRATTSQSRRSPA